MYLSSFSILLPSLLGIAFFKSLYPMLKLLIVFIVLTAGLELWVTLLHYHGTNNMFLFHLHTYLEFTVFSTIFLRLLKGRRNMIIVIGLIAVFLGYLMYTLVNGETFERLNWFIRVLESAILITFALMYIRREFIRLDQRNLKMNPYFVLSAGLLIYFFGTLTIFLFFQLMNDDQFTSVWVVHSLLNIFLNIIYASVIWQGSRVLRS